MTKPSRRWNWGEGAQRAFEALKSALVSPPVLTFFDPEAELRLYTDASEVGLGAMLTQTKNGEEKVLSYASRILRPAETNYSVSERECLAVVWACERLKTYFSVPVQDITDHEALAVLTTKKTLKGRLARWALQLQEFPITIEPRKAAELVVPDALSRAPVDPPVEIEESGEVPDDQKKAAGVMGRGDNYKLEEG
ncbi:reverse ribonuclease integrase, partial [Lasius niger]